MVAAMAQLSPDAALAALLERARGAPFFELVSALERLFPERPQLGQSGPFADEPVHFSHARDLSFSVRDVHDATRTPDGHIALMTTFLGLTGSTSPLPLYIAEEVAQEDTEHAYRGAFLDLFHHRLISLLYRALFDLSYARAYRAAELDPITECLVSLTGLLGGQADEDGFLRHLHLRYASLLLNQPGSVEALESALSDTLAAHIGQASVRVVCFVGDRVALADDLLSRLGQNTRLSVSFLLGTRVRDRASKLRICIGPLDRDGYHSLLPGAPGFALTQRVIHAMLREPIAYELELQLVAGCGRPFRLSRDRLGQMTWLGSSPEGARVRFTGIAKLAA